MSMTIVFFLDIFLPIGLNHNLLKHMEIIIKKPWAAQGKTIKIGHPFRSWHQNPDYRNEKIISSQICKQEKKPAPEAVVVKRRSYFVGKPYR